MIISRFIQVAANGIISFFFLAESYSIMCVCVCTSLSSHLSMDIYILAIVHWGTCIFLN